MISTIQLEAVVDELPSGLKAIQAEASREGYQLVERLTAEWASHTTRFDREGESLLAAYIGGELVGIGGITIEPVVIGALRMRRFYVSTQWRRWGIGRKLASSLLESAQGSHRMSTVNAGTVRSSLFWEALGFMPDLCDGHTHSLYPNTNVLALSG